MGSEGEPAENGGGFRPTTVERLVRRRRLRLIAGLLVLAVFVSATLWRAAVRGDRARFPFDESLTYRVVRVVDGDTLLLESGHRVRLLGIDTPETVHPDRPAEPFGKEASRFMRDRVEGKTVMLLFDRERLDKYDRVLAWVLVDGNLVNEAIVRAGLSRAVLLSPLRPDFRKRLVEAEKEAAADGRGVHSLGGD